MNTPRLISALAVVGSIACAAAPTAASAATTDGQSASSANWSGYVAGGSPSGSSKQFSSISGSWVEPSANCSAGQGYAAFWVGLGGAGQGSNALEQTGTEADCGSDGTSSHFAWYELVPAAPVKLDLKISAGDHLTGKVTVNGTNVTVALSDTTTGQSVTKNLQMNNPDVSSAEWIAEAPSSCDGSGSCQPLPLTDFGNVSFSNSSATANGHTGTISDQNWTSTPVQLTPGAGNQFAGAGFVSDAGSGSDTSSAGATPSTLSSDGSAFSVAWGGSTADPTSASSGSSSAAGAGYPGSGYPGSGYPSSGWDDGSGWGGASGYGDGSGWGDAGSYWSGVAYW
jgi:Peptidase A4 family